MARPKGKLPDELVRFVGRQLQGAADGDARLKRLARSDQRARLQRQRERTKQWFITMSVICVLFAAVSVYLLVGVTGPEFKALMPAFVTVVSGLLAVRGGRKLRELNRRYEAAPPRLYGIAVSARAGLPPAGSQAREPMRRLRESEMSLVELIRQLWSPDGTGPIPRDAVHDAVRTADDAATAARRLADQVRAVESARSAAPPADREELAEAVREMRARLDDGVAGYSRLVGAAGRAVAASSSADATVGLTDATDNLQGLALALRELSERGRIS